MGFRKPSDFCWSSKQDQMGTAIAHKPSQHLQSCWYSSHGAAENWGPEASAGNGATCKRWSCTTSFNKTLHKREIREYGSILFR